MRSKRNKEKKRKGENEHILTFVHAVMDGWTSAAVPAATAGRLVRAPFIIKIDSWWILPNSKRGKEKTWNLETYDSPMGFLWQALFDLRGRGDNQCFNNSCYSLQGAIAAAAAAATAAVPFLCFFSRGLSIKCFNDCRRAKCHASSYC